MLLPSDYHYSQLMTITTQLMKVSGVATAAGSWKVLAKSAILLSSSTLQLQGITNYKASFFGGIIAILSKRTLHI